MEVRGIIIGILGFILLVVVIVGLNCITTVPTGFVGVKTRFGKVQDDVIQEGLNTKAPFIEKIVKIDCKTKKIETATEGSTKDMQTVSTSIAVNYNVNKETANKLYKEVGKEYEDVIINPAIQESIKASMAGYTAEELITKRSEVSNKIEDSITEKISDKGFIVTEFNLTNIDFSEAYDQAIEAKAVKQQEVETSKAELEKTKINNEREVQIAEKDAKIMELKNSQITENILRLKSLEVQQSMINKWNGGLPQTSLGDNIMSLFQIGQ